FGIDNEGMHGVVATPRQSRDDCFSSVSRHDGVGRERVSHDSIVNLRVNRALIHADAGATGSARLDGLTEALNDVGFSRARFVLQGHQESARMRHIMTAILARPGVNVNHSARPDHHVASVTNPVSKYGRAKAGG